MWPCAFRNSVACCWCCSLNVFLIAWNSTAVNDGVHCKSNVINVHVGLTHWVPVWPDLNPARVFNPVTWFYIDSEIGSLSLCAWCGSTVLCCVCLYVCVCVCLFHKHIFGTLSAIFVPSFQACYVWPWLGRALSLLRYVVYFRLVGDVMFADDD